jgi:hypothetical protein
MSTPETTPETTPPVDSPTTTEGATVGLKTGGTLAMVLGVLVFLYFLAFHLGAAVLSYQKFGSFLWAILDFFFPYFYYPYYAFVAGKQEVAPVETTGMAGGALRRLMRRLVPVRRKQTFKRI